MHLLMIFIRSNDSGTCGSAMTTTQGQTCKDGNSSEHGQDCASALPNCSAMGVHLRYAHWKSRGGKRLFPESGSHQTPDEIAASAARTSPESATSLSSARTLPVVLSTIGEDDIRACNVQGYVGLCKTQLMGKFLCPICPSHMQIHH